MTSAYNFHWVISSLTLYYYSLACWHLRISEAREWVSFPLPKPHSLANKSESPALNPFQGHLWHSHWERTVIKIHINPKHTHTAPGNSTGRQALLAARSSWALAWPQPGPHSPCAWLGCSGAAQDLISSVVHTSNQQLKETQMARPWLHFYWL